MKSSRILSSHFEYRFANFFVTVLPKYVTKNSCFHELRSTANTAVASRATENSKTVIQKVGARI